MKVLCPHCRARLKAPRDMNRRVRCPRCAVEFYPEGRPGTDLQGKVEKKEGRRKRRPGGRGRIGAALERSASGRRTAKILAIVFVPIAIGITLYFRVIGPLSSSLDVEVEIEAPESVAVAVKHKEKRARGYRGSQRGWNVSVGVDVTNLTKKHLSVGDVQVRFFDMAGNRIKTKQSCSLIGMNLLSDDMNLYLAPGTTERHGSFLAFHLPLGMGKKRVKCVVTVVKVREVEGQLSLKKYADE
jgi:hypothetical protein